jgi:hypothetical protein
MQSTLLTCGNKATHTQWCKAAHDYTTIRKKGTDGAVTVIKKGWSDGTFNNRLTLAKTAWGSRLLKSGEGQGATYTLLPKEKVQPGAKEEAFSTSETTPVQPFQSHPLIGDESAWSGFEGPQSTPKHSNQSNWSGSRESRAEEKPLTGKALLDAALRQLNEPTKH